MINIKKTFCNCLCILLISCSSSIAGSYIFTNADAANSNWSNPANWEGGELPVFDSSCVVTQASSTAVIDTNATIRTMIISETLNSDVYISSPNQLTFELQEPGTFLLNRCQGMVYLQGNYTFYNSVREWDTCVIKNEDSNAGLTFDTNSITYFNARMSMENGQMYFLGEIKKSVSEFRVSADNAVFEESAINNCYMNLKMNSTTITVNTTNLMSSGKIRTTWTSTLTLNTDNSVGDTPNIDADAMLTCNINGNTEFGTLDINCGNTYTITFNLGENVEYLTFEDSSSIDWGDDTLAFNGFRPGVIRFGTSKHALTEVQLSKITADGIGEKGVELDADGWLIALQPEGSVFIIK